MRGPGKSNGNLFEEGSHKKKKAYILAFAELIKLFGAGCFLSSDDRASEQRLQHPTAPPPPPPPGRDPTVYALDSLFVEQYGDHDADDEYHGQDRPHHPDQAVPGVQRLRVRVRGDDGLGVGTGHVHLLKSPTHTCAHA